MNISQDVERALDVAFELGRLTERANGKPPSNLPQAEGQQDRASHALLCDVRGPDVLPKLTSRFDFYVGLAALGFIVLAVGFMILCRAMGWI
jgi:hypothetical protein